MWITGIWNPLSEFPDILQILQEKVRQNVIWGYNKGLANRQSFIVVPITFGFPLLCGCLERQLEEAPRLLPVGSDSLL
jgi:hypothetical protein